LQYAKRKQDELEDYKGLSFSCSDSEDKRKIIEVRYYFVSHLTCCKDLIIGLDCGCTLFCFCSEYPIPSFVWAFSPIILPAIFFIQCKQIRNEVVIKCKNVCCPVGTKTLWVMYGMQNISVSVLCSCKVQSNIILLEANILCLRETQ